MMRDVFLDPKKITAEELMDAQNEAVESYNLVEEGRRTPHLVVPDEKLDRIVVKNADAKVVIKKASDILSLPLWAKNKNGKPIASLHGILDEEAEPPKAVEAPVGEVKR